MFKLNIYTLIVQKERAGYDTSARPLRNLSRLHLFRRYLKLSIVFEFTILPSSEFQQFIARLEKKYFKLSVLHFFSIRLKLCPRVTAESFLKLKKSFIDIST